VFLSKPLGTGVIATAAKTDRCEASVLEGAVQSMLRLNRVAAQVAQDAGRPAPPTSPGSASATPRRWSTPRGGAQHSQPRPAACRRAGARRAGQLERRHGPESRYLEQAFGRLRIDATVPEALVNLRESETSGGLLAVDAGRAAAVREASRAWASRCGRSAWDRGAGAGGGLGRASSARTRGYTGGRSGRSGRESGWECAPGEDS
jgi:hypothetical protein